MTGTGDAVIRRIADDDPAGRRAFVDIVNAVTPESPTTLAELDWADATYPGGARFLALDGGRAVACASVGRIYMYEAGFDHFWFGIQVLPELRRQGIGTRVVSMP